MSGHNKQTHTSNDISRACILSSLIYNVESTKEWTKKQCWYEGEFHTRSVFLNKNLIGDKGLVDVGYYISHRTLYIVYSGTEAAEFWLYNIDTDAVTYNGIRFHEGFLNLATEIGSVLTEDDFIYNIIKKNDIQRIVHCGHSTGGAVAGIMPMLISKLISNHVIIDFGAPKYLADQKPGFVYPFPRLRFQEIYDIIPCIPLTWRGPLPGFHQFGDVIYLNSNGYLDKMPWYRPLFFIWKYLTPLFTRGPITEALSHHKMSNYASIIISET